MWIKYIFTFLNPSFNKYCPPRFGLTPAETKKFIANWAGMQATGITVAGVKYMFLRGPPMEEKKVLGKKGDTGVIIVKTTQAFIVSLYEAPIISEQVGLLSPFLNPCTRFPTMHQILHNFTISPLQCGPTTEKLADYLVSVGY